jgi:hypothetical protein
MKSLRDLMEDMEYLNPDPINQDFMEIRKLKKYSKADLIRMIIGLRKKNATLKINNRVMMR